MSIGGSIDVSKKKERHKITDWMQNKVAPNCYVRTFMFVDFLYMFSFSVLSFVLTLSFVFSIIIGALVIAFSCYLFEYKDKRRKYFVELSKESCKKKVLWTFLSYSILISSWYVSIKYEFFFHDVFIFMRTPKLDAWLDGLIQSLL